MTRQSGARAKSNGAEFEDYLDRVVFKAALDRGYFARIDKLNPTYVAVRNRAGVTFKPKARSGADWIALGGRQCQWSYIAIEAKSVDGDALPRSAILAEQSAHLEAAERSGQLGILIIRFNGLKAQTYVVRWCEQLFRKRGNGHSLHLDQFAYCRGVNPGDNIGEMLSHWPLHA